MELRFHLDSILNLVVLLFRKSTVHMGDFYCCDFHGDPGPTELRFHLDSILILFVFLFHRRFLLVTTIKTHYRSATLSILSPHATYVYIR